MVSFGSQKLFFYCFWIFGFIIFLTFHLFVFKAQYLLLKSSNKFRIFTVTIFIIFEYLVVLLFLSFHLFVFKAQYLQLKVAKNLEFSQQQFYIIFLFKKISNFSRQSRVHKKVTDYWNVHNPAYVFWTCPTWTMELLFRNFVNG